MTVRRNSVAFGDLRGWIDALRKSGELNEVDGEVSGRAIFVGQSLIWLVHPKFNVMLESISTAPALAHVHHLDLRGTLASGSTYKKDWANELHPTAKGFGTIADKFAATIATV